MKTRDATERERGRAWGTFAAIAVVLVGIFAVPIVVHWFHVIGDYWFG